MRLTNGFMENSGMVRNSSVLMLPFSSLSSLLKRLYSLLISFGETVQYLVLEKIKKIREDKRGLDEG